MFVLLLGEGCKGAGGCLEEGAVVVGLEYGSDVPSLAVCMVGEWVAGMVVWQGVESGFSVLALWEVLECVVGLGVVVNSR